MAKDNYYYKFKEPCKGSRGVYVGLKGIVLDTNDKLFTTEFLVIFDDYVIPVWVDSWDIEPVRQ